MTFTYFLQFSTSDQGYYYPRKTINTKRMKRKESRRKKRRKKRKHEGKEGGGQIR